jgi:DNA-binding Lrp family transcriptional regulator
MYRFTAAFGMMLAVGGVTPAMATSRAYVLIETTSDKVAKVHESLGSFANCKALAVALMPAEIVVHVECNDLASLNRVVTEEIPSKDGVKRATLWLVMSRD